MIFEPPRTTAIKIINSSINHNQKNMYSSLASHIKYRYSLSDFIYVLGGAGIKLGY